MRCRLVVYGTPYGIQSAAQSGMHYSRSHDALIRVYDFAGNPIQTHEHAGEFNER